MARQHAGELLDAVEKIEKAFDLEPPLRVGSSPFGFPSSRFRQSTAVDREWGENSKKNSLGELLDNGDILVWEATTDQHHC